MNNETGMKAKRDAVKSATADFESYLESCTIKDWTMQDDEGRTSKIMYDYRDQSFYTIEATFDEDGEMTIMELHDSIEFFDYWRKEDIKINDEAVYEEFYTSLTEENMEGFEGDPLWSPEA